MKQHKKSAKQIARTQRAKYQLFELQNSLLFSYIATEMGHFLSTALTALGYPYPDCQEKTLYFKKLSDQATTPSRGTDLAAGYDLYSAEEKTIPKEGKALIMTDIAIALPVGCYGRVAPR